MNWSSHLIKIDSSIISALQQLESLSGEILCLFVTDTDNRLIGSLTDGDIRRFLISGGSLSDKVAVATNRKCFSIK